MSREYKSIPRTLSDGSVRVYHYHKVTKKRIQGEPGTKGWAAALAAAGKTDAVKPELAVGSVGWLIEQMRRSPQFAALSPATQPVYERGWQALAPIAAAAAIDVKPRHITAIYDSLLPKVGLANQFRTAASVLFRFGVRKGAVETNPVAEIEREPGGHWPEWTDQMIATFKAKAHTLRKPHARIAFNIGLYTGMREGDVCSLTWHHYDGRYLRYTPQKTAKKVGLELRIPVHPELKAVLDEARANATSIYVLANPWGQRMTESGFRKMWARSLSALEMPHIGYHGSRKAAVIMLAHMGCTVHEIMSWTGHSMQMVVLYTKGVNQSRLSDAVYEKLTRVG